MNWFKKAQLNKLSMNAVEFVRRLRKNPNINVTQRGKKLINLDNGFVTIIHDWHRGQDLGIGIIKSMLRDIGLDESDLIYSRKSRKKTVEQIVPQEDPKKEKQVPAWQNNDWFQNQQQYEE